MSILSGMIDNMALLAGFSTIPQFTMAGLEPAIQLSIGGAKLGGRVKPAHGE